MQKSDDFVGEDRTCSSFEFFDNFVGQLFVSALSVNKFCLRCHGDCFTTEDEYLY